MPALSPVRCCNQLTTTRFCPHCGRRLHVLAIDRASLVHCSLAVLRLTLRAQNLLERAGMFTVAALTARTRSQLAELPGVGEVTVQEVEAALETVGMRLESDQPRTKTLAIFAG